MFVLQAFAAQPANTVFVEVLRLFVPASVGQTLGFLFQHQAAQHQASVCATPLRVPSRTDATG